MLNATFFSAKSESPATVVGEDLAWSGWLIVNSISGILQCKGAGGSNRLDVRSSCVSQSFRKGRHYFFKLHTNGNFGFYAKPKTRKLALSARRTSKQRTQAGAHAGSGDQLEWVGTVVLDSSSRVFPAAINSFQIWRTSSSISADATGNSANKRAAATTTEKWALKTSSSSSLQGIVVLLQQTVSHPKNRQRGFTTQGEQNL